ncbi:MAG: hypothetical protein ACREHV_17195 [Rhizomicrobium sp.]
MPRYGNKGAAMRLGLVSAAVSVVILSVTPAFASCDEETIDTVSEDGDMIVLTNGQSFDVVGGDEVTASLWMEGQDVLVCDDTMINKDENGEKVEITPH